MSTIRLVLFCTLFLVASLHAQHSKLSDNEVALNALEKLLPGQQYFGDDLKKEDNCYVDVLRSTHPQKGHLEYFRVQIFNLSGGHEVTLNFYRDEKKSKLKKFSNTQNSLHLSQKFFYKDPFGRPMEDLQKIDLLRNKENLEINILNRKKHLNWYKTFKAFCHIKLPKKNLPL